MRSPYHLALLNVLERRDVLVGYVTYFDQSWNLNTFVENAQNEKILRVYQLVESGLNTFKRIVRSCLT
jgi:hypothetical protein